MSKEGSISNLTEMYLHLDRMGLVKSKKHDGFTSFYHEESAWPRMILREAQDPFGYESFQAMIASVIGEPSPRTLLLTAEQVDQLGPQAIQGMGCSPVARWDDMSIHFSEKAPLEGGLSDVEVVQPTDLERFRIWLSICEKVLFRGSKLSASLFSEAGSAGKMVYLLGRHASEYVSAALLFKGESAGAYMVSVLPSHRRMGLGAKMMQSVHEKARAAGYNRVVLQSTREGIPLYSAMGYASHSKMILFNINL